MGRLRVTLVGATLLVAGCGSAGTPAPTGSTTAPAVSSAPAVSESASTTGVAPTPPATTSSAPSSDAPSPDVAAPARPADLITGLDVPWSVAFLGDVAFVSLRDSGRIMEIDGSSSREVGTIEGVEAAGEGGLLGLAVLAGSPNYLYAYFTGADDNRIVRYELTGGPGAYGLGAVGEVFSGIPKAGNHNGGRIKFGPDRMLYVTSGDAGDRDAAQDPDSVSGKILRLDPSGAPAAGNPIAGNPMWSLGHRNPQGIGWQADGTMWAAEFGQDTWDELNIITPGANYGWPEVEGIGGDARFVDPVHQWATDDASPSGLAVVGDVVYIAALRGQRLIGVSTADPSVTTDFFVGDYGRLRDVLPAPDGSLWLLTNNTDGRGTPRDGDDRILRLAPPTL